MRLVYLLAYQVNSNIHCHDELEFAESFLIHMVIQKFKSIMSINYKRTEEQDFKK